MNLPCRRVYLLMLTGAGGALNGKQGAHVGKSFSTVRFRRLFIQDAVGEIRGLSSEMGTSFRF